LGEGLLRRCARSLDGVVGLQLGKGLPIVDTVRGPRRSGRMEARRDRDCRQHASARAARLRAGCPRRERMRTGFRLSC